MKGCGFLSFAENTRENFGQNVNGKYSQNFLDNAKQSAADAHKTASKRAFHKTAEANVI